MSLSLSLDNALTGLNVNKQALAVLSQNIANANTAGYTRQAINQQSVSIDGRGVGVAVDNVTRKIDEYLVRSVRLQGSDVGKFDTISDYMGRIQLYLGSPGSSNSIDSFATTFFNSLQSLSQTPESASLRVNTVNSGVQLARQIATLAQSLQDLRFQADQDIDSAADKINTALRDINDLNGVITNNTLLGKSSAELEDRRETLLRTVAQYVDIQTYTKETGAINIFTAGGVSLLDDNLYVVSYDPVGSVTSFIEDAVLPALQVRRLDGAGNPAAAATEIVTSAKSRNVSTIVTGGSIRGLVDIRDRKIPDILDALDGLAANLRDAFNAIHNAGSSYPPANSYTGSRLLGGDDYSQWSGSIRIATLDQNGKPLKSPYTSEVAGVPPLTLNLSTLDTGNGPGKPSLQGIIDEINQRFGAQQNKVKVGNLNNIRLATNNTQLPSLPPTFNFDLDIENISDKPANVFVQGITVRDSNGVDITSVAQDVPKFALNPAVSPGTFITANDSNIVTVNTTGIHKLQVGDLVYLPDGGVDANGIESGDLAGYFTVTSVSPTSFQINAKSRATSGGAVSVSGLAAAPRYARSEAGTQERTTGQGTMSVDLSANNLSPYYTITVNVSVLDENNQATVSQISYRVANQQFNLRNRRYSAETVVGSGTIEAPSSVNPLAMAMMVDEKGMELPKFDGKYTNTKNGYLKIVGFNGNYTVAIDSLDSAELGKPNASPVEPGTKRGFSHYFGMNHFFSSFKEIASGDTVRNSALNLKVDQRLINNPNLLSTGTLTRSKTPADSTQPSYTYERTSGDNSAILKLAQLSNTSIAFAPAGQLGETKQSFGSYAAQIVSTASADASSATLSKKNSQLLMDGFTQRSDTISGVNLDEELANTVIYQNAYSASARIISVTNDLFDALFNSFGR